MEADLDRVAGGGAAWTGVLESFWESEGNCDDSQSGRKEAAAGGYAGPGRPAGSTLRRRGVPAFGSPGTVDAVPAMSGDPGTDQHDRAVEADGAYVLVVGQGHMSCAVLEPHAVASDAGEDGLPGLRVRLHRARQREQRAGDLRCDLVGLHRRRDGPARRPHVALVLAHWM